VATVRRLMGSIGAIKAAPLLLLLGLMLPASVAASMNPQIEQAIRHAYNFDFESASRLLAQYRQHSPGSPLNQIAAVIYRFLLINQNPDEDNFTRMYQALEEAEQRLGSTASPAPSGDDPLTLEFFQCLVDYYYMKTCALDGSWVRSVRHAVRARRSALALRDAGYANPDLPYILGDQDYSTALVPPHLKLFLAPLNFTPDREAGISHILQTVKQGGLMQPEAAIMYISANIYVEHDYRVAMDTVKDFLQDYPGNLTARFYFIDLLLREGDLASADQLLTSLNAQHLSGSLSGKWEARLLQMRGNRLNAAGDYRGAVALYQQALGHPDFNGFSATEAALEMGKLLDILGDRQGAREAYRLSYRSRGLELLKTEARELRSQGFSGSTGSY